MLHLPGSLEPQLRLSVAPCEVAPVISSVAAQFYRRSKRGSGWHGEGQRIPIMVEKNSRLKLAEQKESGRRYRGDAHVGVLRMLLLR